MKLLSFFLIILIRVTGIFSGGSSWSSESSGLPSSSQDSSSSSSSSGFSSFSSSPSRSSSVSSSFPTPSSSSSSSSVQMFQGGDGSVPRFSFSSSGSSSRASSSSSSSCLTSSSSSSSSSSSFSSSRSFSSTTTPSPSDNKLFPESPFIPRSPDTTTNNENKLKNLTTDIIPEIKNSSKKIHDDFLELKKAGDELKLLLPTIHCVTDGTIINLFDLPIFNYSGILIHPNVNGSIDCKTIEEKITENDKAEIVIINFVGDLVDYIRKIEMEIQYYTVEIDTYGWSDLQLQKLDDFVGKLNNLLVSAKNQERIIKKFYESFRRANLEIKIFNDQMAPTITFNCDQSALQVVQNIQKSFYDLIEVKYQEARRIFASTIGRLERAVESFLAGFVSYVDYQQVVEIQQVASILGINSSILTSYVRGENSTNEAIYECAKAIVIYDDKLFELYKEEMTKMVNYVHFYAQNGGILAN